MVEIAGRYLTIPQIALFLFLLLFLRLPRTIRKILAKYNWKWYQVNNQVLFRNRSKSLPRSKSFDNGNLKIGISTAKLTNVCMIKWVDSSYKFSSAFCYFGGDVSKCHMRHFSTQHSIETYIISFAYGLSYTCNLKHMDELVERWFIK